MERLLPYVFAFASLCGAVPAGGQRTLLRAGQLLDVHAGRISRDVTIVVERGRVTAIEPTVSAHPSDIVVDLSRYVVLPGLIDAHVHLAIGGSPAANALANLNAGFTTIVDLGSRTTRLLSIRDSINSGMIPGPRTLAAGIWIGVKDGVCEFNGIGIAGDADAFRARVRANVNAGADVIKACVSGWPADAFARPDAYEMPDSVLQAIVTESNRLNRRTIAHDISAGGVAAAVRAGVDGLAHAAYVDSAAASILATRGVFMIPTLASLAGNDSSDASRALRRSVLTAHRVGVPLVFGTDAGVLPHGQNASEFEALVAAGIPLLDALRAATINSARAFALADSIGTIEPGKIADIIAVEGDPLGDPTALLRVRFVMSRGRVVRSDSAVAR